MASLGVQRSTLLLLIINVILLLFVQVISIDEEGNLLSAFNSYRQSHGLPPLSKHDKAGCLATEIADEIEDKPCPPTPITVAPGSQPGLDNYRDLVKKCGIDMNTTKDGVILPVCVPNSVATLILTNYTQSEYAMYLNSSKYTGAGIGEEDEWTVVVLASDSPEGSFSSATCLSHGLSHHALLMFIFLPLFLVILN